MEMRRESQGETQRRTGPDGQDQSPHLCNIPGIGLTSPFCWQRRCLFSRRTGGWGETSQPLSMEGQSCQNLTWVSFQFLNKRTCALWGLFLPKGWVRVMGLSCTLLGNGVPMTISLPWSWPWPRRNTHVADAGASNPDAHSFFGGVRRGDG